MSTRGERRIFTVSRLNQEVQQSLERSFGTLWLQAELSSLSRPGSGHLYFTLKDSQAQIRCAMFRGRARYLGFEPSAGDEVLVRGKLGLYSPRGDYQLIVEHMEAAGEGRLRQQFEETRRRLHALGWFDEATKLSPPALPRTIGVITSPTGAAIRDVLTVLERRMPLTDIIIYPSVVQGAQAVPSLIDALRRATRRREVDLLLLVRGGGSLEDLWAFNDETLAAAIRECPLPIIAGIGHEVDVTIADMVADRRAPTPSAAAEFATPDVRDLSQAVSRLAGALARLTDQRLQTSRDRFDALHDRLGARHPARLLQERQQRIDELAGRLTRALQHRRSRQQDRLEALRRRLSVHSPRRQLQQRRLELGQWQQRLDHAAGRLIERQQTRLALAARALHTVSPLATLERGFAVVRHEQRVLRHIDQVAPGDALDIRLRDGTVTSTVTGTVPLTAPEEPPENT